MDSGWVGVGGFCATNRNGGSGSPSMKHKGVFVEFLTSTNIHERIVDLSPPPRADLGVSGLTFGTQPWP